jgi:hypothetical protein
VSVYVIAFMGTPRMISCISIDYEEDGHPAGGLVKGQVESYKRSKKAYVPSFLNLIGLTNFFD